ncbi:hypothetical protein AGDE_02990 [Angomonas deanei]|uniref:Uncharacterized protein n=1 Tax=Angomonas deanei TaxID=59799 RepID=A0A7G2C0F3_9TRYP|nr:hypothetical protein AGDE_02990 [Angomonas deanei]CAD2212794.1 hypothetical protein, conserved [Angomonas deanei]|eukprot:EPY40935.1 hypothetical protein AGDE_02990 [Angomonas deanei]
MERLLLDDPENKDDPKSSNIYKYSPLLTMQFDCARLGPNVVVNKSIHKIPMILIAPRQMVMYVTRAVLLNAEQQTALGVRPKSATDDQDDLNVFIQCGIEYTGDNELTKEDKGYVRGSTFVFFLMGQEEKDGSLTLTYVTDVSSGGSIPSAMADRPNAGQYRMALLIHNLLADMAKDKKNKEGHLVKVFDNDRLFSPLL